MKTKNLITSAVALAIVVLIIVVSNQMANKKPSDKLLKFFPGFSEEACSAILIADSKDTIKIKRTGDVWMVTQPSTKEAREDTGSLLVEDDTKEQADEKPAGIAKKITDYPVDSAAIQSALEKLAAMKKDEIISENPEKQSVFEVDDTKGILVEVWDDKGKSIGKFRIGKNGADWSSHYVRPVGTNTVYSVRGSIKYAFFSDVKRWRDKTILKFDKSQLKKITITKQGSEIVLNKEVDTASNVSWNMVADGQNVKAKTAEVDKIVNELANFRCVEWEENERLTAEDMGFDKPEIVVTAELENGDKKKAIIGKKKEDASRFYTKTPDKDYVFLVYDHIIKRFDDAKIEDLKEDEVKEETSAEKES